MRQVNGHLLSSSGEGSGSLKQLLHDKLDSHSAEGLERIAEMDPSGVFASLDGSGTNRHVEGNAAVLSDQESPSGDVDRVQRSELQQTSSFRRRVPIVADDEMLGGPLRTTLC